jgi:hypothetical protein
LRIRLEQRAAHYRAEALELARESEKSGDAAAFNNKQVRTTEEHRTREAFHGSAFEKQMEAGRWALQNFQEALTPSSEIPDSQITRVTSNPRAAAQPIPSPAQVSYPDTKPKPIESAEAVATRQEGPESAVVDQVEGLGTAPWDRVSRQTDAERLGRRRAELVGQLIKELNALRPQLQVPDEDYPKLVAENPGYEAFKIAKNHPAAAKYIKQTPDRPRVNTLAYKIAAIHFSVSSETIKNAWRKYKPRERSQKT